MDYFTEQFTEQAPTYDECYRKIRDRYGLQAQINVLRQKDIRMKGFLGFYTRRGIELEGVVSRGSRFIVPGTATASPKPAGTPAEPLNFEEEKKKILEKSGKTETVMLKQLLEKVEGLTEKIDAVQTGPAEEHPTLSRIEENLILNDFTPRYRKQILEWVRKEFSLEALEDYSAVQDKVIEWIGESIRIYKEEPSLRKPRIMILVGPTGVGKTTTIAKLAAIYGTDFAGRRPLSVRLVNIDSYRIGAEQQIAKYGEIMTIPVSTVRSARELKDSIALAAAGVDLILVDTIGRSPRKTVELAEMREFLSVCPSAEYHLVVMAGTRVGDMAAIMQEFEVFGYRSVLITKMDESGPPGNIISVLAEKRKAVSFITDGQGVPNDIQEAGPIRFLMALEGFTINRTKIEERFRGKSDYIQWRE
ncbi:MAG: flagellar biosynthesis protein FlhF [Treponema sp.]|nr:flagellar biosynthesis protein FlhF [Treponema sp.]